MNNLLEQLSKKIGRGAFAIRYIPAAVIVFFITGGVWNADISIVEGLVLIVAGLYGALLCIQRLNDLELSRWYFLFSLIPIVSLVLGVILLTRKGNFALPIGTDKDTGDVDSKMKPHSNLFEKVGISDVTSARIKEHNSTKFCWYCLTENPKNAEVCSSCGKPFK